jgi:pyrroloquinoline quinone biosynthesis protein D
MRRSFSRNLCDTKTVQMIPESIPAFPRGVKYRYDAARSAWVVLSPERVLLPDETGQAILSAVDGKRTVSEIARQLAARFDAPFMEIEADVLELRGAWALSGVVQDKGAVV